jgi:phosphatidylinositol-3-phosphatase
MTMFLKPAARAVTRLLALSLAILLLTAVCVANAPRSKHVVVVVLENHSYHSALAEMPWLKSQALKYSYTRYYYANTHPSIGNYFMMTTGRIVTNSSGYAGTVTGNNLVRQFLVGGKSWKVYAESLPYAGYIGGDRYPYVKRHNPFAYFADVRNSSSQRYNLVPLSRFHSDLRAGHLPHFSFIVPNQRHNGHDASLSTADTWLRQNVAPLLSNPEFREDGILIITFDESHKGDRAHGGGRILTVAVGPKVRRGYRDSTYYYQHQALLRTVEEALGLPAMGAATTSKSLERLF